MNGEIAIAGVYMPALLLIALAASIVTLGLMRIADRFGFYRVVAYRALVDLCLYVLVLGALAFLSTLFGLHS